MPGYGTPERFPGRRCPEALGDYVAGPNHVLPTGRTARFASGLSVFDFLKRTTFVAADAAALAQVGPAAVALAEAEGLQAHARSVAVRLADRMVSGGKIVGEKRSACRRPQARRKARRPPYVFPPDACSGALQSGAP